LWLGDFHSAGAENISGYGYVQDYGRFANWLAQMFDLRAPGFGIVLLVVVIGGSIPFLAYLGYRFVLGGFYPEGLG